MTRDKTEPLTGDAKWQAERKAIAANNDAAHKRARKDRDAEDAAVHARRREVERREMDQLPSQPTRPTS
ncbi:MAG: hypothetical protein AVDCRST_MAG85-3074 [uncultured Solirubrobacteraceae bacterium]|uniref:Uncharacterized protein n=1 Tax=uncultured Solirubrobacteraceae bacterium TaxID=1162706 RepID=A0A6J4TIF1_9ACTN|nr:MAG: hypothetical protein AVDCRST_MAG85-3074 [uncultured Solirubrobacteraceae bacterium]